jgi:dolichol kinase
MISFLSLPVSAMYFAFGVCSLIIAVQHYKRPELHEYSINDFMMACIYFFCCIVFPFMYITADVSQEWAELFFLLADVVLYGFAIFLFGFIFREVIRARRNPALKDERSYHRLMEKAAGFKMDNKRDASRKILHVIPVAVIILLYFISEALAPVLPIGMTSKGLAFFGIVTIGFAFATMFMLAETLRLINDNKLFCFAPDWAQRWFSSSLKPSESQAIISSIPAILCLMPFLFGPFTIFLTVALVESLADAMASVIGKRFGKHKIPACPHKSFEGMIAGGLTAFCMTLLGFVLVPWLAVTWPQVLLLAAGTAAIFMLIDVFSKKIMDNILNPLVCGAFMIVFLALLGIT